MSKVEWLQEPEKENLLSAPRKEQINSITSYLMDDDIINLSKSLNEIQLNEKKCSSSSSSSSSNRRLFSDLWLKSPKKR